MGLLSSLYQQQQQINQNPTSAIRTPIQNAYDNLLNAQSNAQNTAKEEWGSAIGNSVNGLAKIIASSVIGNPIEKAASTRNLDNFDARQDALVRQWAMEQAKKRNDFVNQAREQLGMAKADEEQAYNRQQDAYKKMIDERNFNNIVKQQEIANKWKEIEDINKKEALEQAKIQQDIENKRIAENDILDRAYKQAQIDKLNRENSPEYILQQQEQAQKEAEDKAKAEKEKEIRQEVKSLNDKGAIDSPTYIAITNNTELRDYLRPKDNASGGFRIFGTTISNANPNTYEIDFEQILKDKGIEKPTKAQIKALKKELGL
ncbi:MAG: hypothetical protein II417_00785 [Elusimicrobia bacterium]|nr:hypothetical protein [Elusimicrobiota bacterium]